MIDAYVAIGRVTDAFEKQKMNYQPIEEAFKALGFNPEGMDKTNRRKAAESTAYSKILQNAGKNRGSEKV